MNRRGFFGIFCKMSAALATLGITKTSSSVESTDDGWVLNLSEVRNLSIDTMKRCVECVTNGREDVRSIKSIVLSTDQYRWYRDYVISGILHPWYADSGVFELVTFGNIPVYEKLEK